MDKIGVLGLTHLGCVLSASWSKLGLETVGVDLNEQVVKNLQQGIPPIFEPGLETEIKNEKTPILFQNIGSCCLQLCIFWL